MSDNVVVTEEMAAEHGLSAEEFQRMCAILDRLPTWAELGVFSVMWSEHCSYKSSRVYLAELPTEAPWVVQGPGENAGAVDIGDGLAAVFKMESHNHPSFIEPYQGAATGVGGILRDVFTMGARPVASLNSLRFGAADHPRTGYLVAGVVAGIGDYGNSFGCPTVGGETHFHPSYDANILVNAFTLGIARTDRIFLGKAAGVGNPVLYVGSKTGRDGIHGATMASEEFTEDSEQRRPTVQVGDPFTEKLLLEACLEVMKSDAVVGIQDMGAAGLTSSSFEMAARAGTGVKLDLDRVPLREEGMTPYEILLSESQERMLLVAAAGREEEVERIFRKWDLDVEVVGEVTDDGHVTVLRHGEVVVRIPARPLADQAPRYERPCAEPAYLSEVQRFDPAEVPEPEDLDRTLADLVSSPNLGSRAWIVRQYDQTVRTNTLAGPGGDAAVLRVKGTPRALALSSDCNHRWCYLDPRSGAAHAVAEAARNLACTGARPLGVTDCLNFGNPENPEIMWQFREAVRGMADACRALKAPVVSGNVSFYNETNGQAIHPAPVVAMVGLLEDASLRVRADFPEPGLPLFLLGDPAEPPIAASEYLARIHGREAGAPPPLDLEAEARLGDLLRELAGERLLASAHDCSEGGLAVALLESCLLGTEGGSGRQPVGATVSLPPYRRADAALFGEAAGRVLVSAAAGSGAGIQEAAARAGVPCTRLGTTDAGGRLRIEGERGRGLVDMALGDLLEIWSAALPNVLE
jgi:phosphoribosylformylglycinamidine synthase